MITDPYYIKLQKYLVMRTSDIYTSYAGQAWDEFMLDHIRTSSIRITVIEVYTSDNNGFIELEFYTGMSELSFL